MRILLVEDSKRLQRAIAMGLKKAGYAVDLTGDGKEGLWFAESYEYDVIILDIMLPGMDGLSLLGRLRERGRSTHVLILTAKDTVKERVAGLRAGADDYLVKPFAFEELLARVQALVRRCYGIKKTSLAVGNLKIDTLGRVVSRGGKPLHLTPREYSLLELLAMRRGTVVSRTEIEEHLYDDAVELSSNVIDAAVCTLRRKIDTPGEASLIKTRRGMGYLIE